MANWTVGYDEKGVLGNGCDAGNAWGNAHSVSKKNDPEKENDVCPGVVGEVPKAWTDGDTSVKETRSAEKLCSGKATEEKV